MDVSEKMPLDVRGFSCLAMELPRGFTELFQSLGVFFFVTPDSLTNIVVSAKNAAEVMAFVVRHHTFEETALMATVTGGECLVAFVILLRHGALRR